MDNRSIGLSMEYVGYCTCPKCGGRADVDVSVVLTSIPAQYSFVCPHCGHHGYVRCSETMLHNITGETPFIPAATGESSMYQMIADENELRWFFDHVVQKPQVNESYSMVFVCRHKKLTKEEQKTIGLTRSQSEFLATQSVRKKAFTGENADAADSWTFSNFLKHVKRFNVDKYAYTTALGDPLPEKTLAVIFYVNPCDDIKVADAITEQISNAKTALTKALLSGKKVEEMLQHYQVFGNLENNVKHFKANQKGTRYWMDFDIDVPQWFKDETKGDKFEVSFFSYFQQLKNVFTNTFGKGNYVIVDTSGGYHVLVKTSSIKKDPHIVCKLIQSIYDKGIENGEEPYLDDKGNCKFECIVNDSQIPGLPLPGTYQYGRPVTVLNKEDFE